MLMSGGLEIEALIVLLLTVLHAGVRIVRLYGKSQLFVGKYPIRLMRRCLLFRQYYFFRRQIDGAGK